MQIVPSGEPGSAGQPLADGDEIEYIPVRGMAELVDDFKNQLTPMINDMRRMIAELNRPDGDFRKSVAGVSTVFRQLPETNREMLQVLRDTDRTVVALGRQAEASRGSVERARRQLERQGPPLAPKRRTTPHAAPGASAPLRHTAPKTRAAL